MCEQKSTFGKFSAWFAGYFSTPTLAKGMPTFAVTGANYLDFTVLDIVNILTAIYTVTMIVCSIPKVVQSFVFIKNLIAHKKQESGDDSAS